MGALIFTAIVALCVYGWFRLDMYQRHRWNRAFWNVLIWGAIAATLYNALTGRPISAPSFEYHHGQTG